MKFQAVLFVLLLSVGRIGAGQSTWIAPGGGNWHDATKWNDGIPNAAGAQAIFSSSAPTTASTVELASLVELTTLDVFTGSELTLSGTGPLRFLDDGEKASELNFNSSRLLTVAAPLEIAGSQLLVDVQPTITPFGVELAGSLSGQGKLVKRGAGTLSFSGTNELHAADIEIEAGTVIASTAAVASDSGRFVLRDGSRLVINASNSITLINKPLVSDDATIELHAIAPDISASLSAPIELVGNAVFFSAESLELATLSGVISGPGGIIYRTPNTSSFREVFVVQGDNTYDGVTIIDLGPAGSTGGRRVRVDTATGLGSSVGHTIVRGHLIMEEGSSEPFVVEPRGFLQLTPSDITHAGKVTLMSGVLSPRRRLSDESDLAVQMSGDIELVQGGQIGTGSSNPLEMTGDVSGTGSLVFSGGGPLRFLGEVAVEGDLIFDTAATVNFEHTARPSGDIFLSNGHQGGPSTTGEILWRATDKIFGNDVRLNDRRMAVETDLVVDDLILDPRQIDVQAHLLKTTLEVDPAADVQVLGELVFRGGAIRGSLSGIDRIDKTSILNGSLARLGADFNEPIAVHEGLLAIEDSGGTGSTAGATYVEGRDRAVLQISENVVVRDDVYLNNARGFQYGGALTGPGTLAGDLHLGSQGSYIGYGGIGGNLPGAVGGTLTLAARIHGGNLFKTGNSELVIASNEHTYVGATEVLGGELVLKHDGQLKSTSEIVLRRYSSDTVTTLRLDNTDARLDDRIDDNLRVRLAGEVVLQLLGNVAGASSETIGHVVAESGQARIRVSPHTANALTTLNLLDVSRLPGASVQFMLDTSRAHVYMPATALDDGLLPWALTGRGDLGNPLDFATIGPDGVVEYSALHQYQSDLNTAAAGNNVRLTSSTTLTADRTINALRIGNSSSSTVNINLNDHRLTLDSGGLLAVGARLNVSNGQLTSGSGELLVHNYSGSDLAADIVDNGATPVAVTFAGSGDTRVGGNNSYTGGTFVTGQSQVHAESQHALPDGGDVTVSEGTLRLGAAADGFWKLGTLTLQGGLIRAADGAPGVQIEAQEYRLEHGQIQVSIRGAGPLTKTGEGLVQIYGNTSSFTGQIVIEQGSLEVLGGATLGSGPAIEQHATIVKAGGALYSVGAHQNELLILDGGDLVTGSQFASEYWSGPIEVRQQSRIYAINEERPFHVSGPIRGAGTLIIAAPFGDGGTRARLSSSLNDFAGDLHVTGGEMELAGSSPNYSGNIIVEATDFSVSNSAALGNSIVYILPAGRFTFDSSLAANLVLSGGTLGFSNSPIIVDGKLRVEGQSLVDTSGSLLSVGLPSRTGVIHAVTNFADGSRLKKLGRGMLRFQGDVNLEGDVELVAFDDRLELLGTVTARSPNTTLNLVGTGVHFSASVKVPAGTSLQILKNGQPVDLTLNTFGNGLSGGGSIASSVVLGNAATVSPGDSAGQLHIAGDLHFGPNNVFQWELINSDGSAGSPAGWDLLSVNGQVVFDAEEHPLVLHVFPTPAVGNLDSYLHAAGLDRVQWQVLASDGLTGYSPDGVVVKSFTPRLTGRFSIESDGKNLFLTYAVPEPASCLLLVVGALSCYGAGRGQRRRIVEL